MKKQAQQRLAGAKPPGWLREPISLQEVIAAVETAKGEKWDAFKDRHGDGGAAAGLQMKRPANITMTIKRYEQRIQRDRAERRQLERAVTM